MLSPPTPTNTMKMYRRRENLLLLFLAVLSLLTSLSEAALSQKICSSQNTASNSPENSIWQSNGHCSTVCAKYAFAIVQGQNCWCSNYIPSDTQSTSLCNEKCPGYPYEYCGSSSSGLYGYIALGASPSGTAGASSATVSTSTQGPGSQEPTTSTSSSSIDATIGQTAGTSTSTTQTSDSASPTTLSTSVKSTWTPTPVVTTIISSGSVITITSTPSVAPMQTSKSGGGLSKGAVAGVVVAAFAGFAVVGLGLFFCLRRRGRDEHIVDSTGMVTTTPSRMGSQMSRNGLLGNPFRTNSVSRHTVYTQHGSSDGGVSPISPIAERRLSKPLVFDQRLNPDLYLHEDSSRVSINTIDDHRDYNRRLNVVNPDPEERD